ncbi:transcriptional regulator [Micromonospora sp. M12]
MAELAALLADGTRAGMCLALLDGRAWTAGELARRAGSPVDGQRPPHPTGPGRATRRGTAGPAPLPAPGRAVGGPADRGPGRTRPGRADADPVLRAATASAALAYARTCYDHLAGRLGVLMYDALLADGRLDRSSGLALTPGGWAWAAGLGVPVDVLRAARRPVVRDCLDWTERRPHLAGALGAALCRRFTELGWIAQGTGRAVRLTTTGRAALAETLRVPVDVLAPASPPAPTSGRA